jgi:hypothetical protein
LKEILKITLIFTTILLIGCKNKYEKKLIGTWYSFQENEKLKFESDSLFVNDISKIGTWNANKNLIEYYWQNYQFDSVKKSTYSYKLKSNDTLIFTSKEKSNNHFKFLKSDNFIDFVFKKNNVFINLDESPNSEFVTNENKYGIKIFVSINQGKIKIKSEYSENIENLNYDLDMILKSIEPYFTNEYNSFPEHFKEKVSLENWRKRKIFYSVFADKKIPKDSINILVEKLKRSKIQNVYQVFETKENKYSDFYNLKMKKL